MNEKIKIGITHGDLNGVGYEVILKAFADEAMTEIQQVFKLPTKRPC